MARATSHNPLIDITNPTRTARNIACAMTFINALVEQGADSLSPDAREGRWVLIDCVLQASLFETARVMRLRKLERSLS